MKPRDLYQVQFKQGSNWETHLTLDTAGSTVPQTIYNRYTSLELVPKRILKNREEVICRRNDPKKNRSPYGTRRLD